jgi:hypothetical protein
LVAVAAALYAVFIYYISIIIISILLLIIISILLFLISSSVVDLGDEQEAINDLPVTVKEVLSVGEHCCWMMLSCDVISWMMMSCDVISWMMMSCHGSYSSTSILNQIYLRV